jgi:hypothetical protein
MSINYNFIPIPITMAMRNISAARSYIETEASQKGKRNTT